MLRGARRWACRHRVGLTTTACVGLGVAGASYYAWSSFKKRLVKSWQEELAKMQADGREEFYSGISWRSAVRSGVEDLTQAVDEVISLPDAEEMRNRMSSCTSANEKRQAWEELKVLTFTRMLVICYSQALLTITTRVHLTLIARYIYTTTTQEIPELSIDNSTKLQYLQKANYVGNVGISHLRNYIERSLCDLLESWPIDRQCSLEDMKSLIEEDLYSALVSPGRNSTTTYQCESMNNTNVLTNFIIEPEERQEEYEKDKNTSSRGDQLEFLMNETRNIFESDEFSTLLCTCFKAIHELLYSYIREHFKVQAGSADLESVQIAMAKLIAVIKHVTNEVGAPDPSQSATVIGVLCESQPLEDFMRWLFSEMGML